MKKKKGESDRKSENRIADPILTDGIGSRVQEISSLVGGKRSLAHKTGLSEAQLYRVISGEAQPKIETVARIASAGRVSLDWLATGKEPMRLEAGAKDQAGAYEAMGFSRDLVRDVIEVLTETLQERNAQLPPDKMAELVVLLCEEIAESEGQKPDRAKVIRLVRLAS